MKTVSRASYLLVLLALNACNQTNEQNKAGQKLDKLSNADTTDYPENFKASSFPNGELVHKTGILKKYEDGGYPIAIITIEFTGGKREETFNLNLEEVKNINQETLSNAIGKHLDFSYVSTMQNALIDIQSNGNSIFKEEAIPVTKEMKSFSGILLCAEKITDGDLPSKITVSNSEKTLDFEYYINDDMVKLNKKTIAVFYEERNSNNLTELKIVK